MWVEGFFFVLGTVFLMAGYKYFREQTRNWKERIDNPFGGMEPGWRERECQAWAWTWVLYSAGCYTLCGCQLAGVIVLPDVVPALAIILISVVWAIFSIADIKDR
jgi:hypothetical protein